MIKKLFDWSEKLPFSNSIQRFLFNQYPAYRRSGGYISFLSKDWKEIHVRLPLNRKTINYMGAVFGGSIYASVDPIFAMQLIRNLGDTYVVWDKAAHIRFLKPIRRTVQAKFIITDELLEEIKNKVAEKQKYDVELSLTLEDAEGKVYAEVLKTIYIAKKI
ncbi:MAG: DUF4442 domain-containing protein [Thermonemataceae bacterium]|nr:DUF4442 domain-containing protein [Thermonemataceae bacterium]